jgi:hypothetical protein
LGYEWTELPRRWFHYWLALYFLVVDRDKLLTKLDGH